MVFLTPIPIISLILTLRIIGNHSANIRNLYSFLKFDWINPVHFHCSISPHLRRNLPKNLMKPIKRSNHKYTEGLNLLYDHYLFPNSWKKYLIFTPIFLSIRHPWKQIATNPACSPYFQYSSNIAKDIDHPIYHGSISHHNKTII